MSAASESDRTKSFQGHTSASENLESDRRIQSELDQADQKLEKHDNMPVNKDSSGEQCPKVRHKLTKHEKQYISNQITPPNAPLKSMKNSKNKPVGVSPDKEETKVNDPYKLIEPSDKKNAGLRRIDQIAQNMDAKCPECNRKQTDTKPTKDLEKKEIRPM